MPEEKKVPENIFRADLREDGEHVHIGGLHYDCTTDEAINLAAHLARAVPDGVVKLQAMLDAMPLPAEPKPRPEPPKRGR